VPIDISNPTNYTSMVSSLDNAMWDNRFNVDNGFFGNYFLYSLNETNSNEINYAAFALINATS
jgi:hypothetical protein